MPTVSSAVANLTESNSAASLSTSGSITVVDADAGESQTQASTQTGAYGTFAIDVNGKWTYTASSAHNELTAGEKVQEVFVVTSEDGKTTNSVTINITGTNDAPVLSAVQDVTFVQGDFAQNLEKVSASDIDGSTSSIRYALADNFGGIFAINSTSGQISLVGAGTVAKDELTTGYDLVVTATDANSGVSTPKTIHVTIDMAVDGTTASLPGSINNWTVAPVNGSNNGFIFTNVSDPTIQVHMPATVTTLSFAGGGSLGLSNNGTIGTITDTTVGIDHTIKIASGTTESDMVVLSTTDSHTVTVIGQADSATKTDAVSFAANVDVTNLNNYFTPGATTSAPVTVHVGAATAVLSDIEAVHFNNANVLIVGAGGYASLNEASAAAKSGDVIYVTDSSLANNANGVINSHADISIYIANGDGANMSLANADQTVRIYGNHSFNMTGTAGADTVHDYTTLSAGMTNNIYGMDGADKLVSHSTDAGAHILTGGAGADMLIGGTGAQLLGGDGNDTLLAFGGVAILSGGAGDDILLNAYGNAAGSTASVNMTGGSGNDTFALMGTDNAAQSGIMKTVVTDLGTGDKIDLSFIEIQGQNKSIDTAADFTAASTNNKATMTTAGTTLTFDANTMIATSSEADSGTLDTNTQLHAGSLVLSNATLTKVSTAITAGHDTLTSSVVDFHTTFAPLTDTYNHHG